MKELFQIQLDGARRAADSGEHRFKPLQRYIQIYRNAFLAAKRAHTADRVTDQLYDFIRREHLGLHVKFLFEFMVINTCITGGKNQHAAVRRLERQRLCDPRALNTKCLCRQIDGRARDCKLLHTVFHAELPEICSSCFNRHLPRSCSRIGKYPKLIIAQATAFVKPIFSFRHLQNGHIWCIIN